MGYYVNPKEMTKEQWLKENAKLIDTSRARATWNSLTSGNELPVCLVDNGPFTAAGICYNEDEFKVFLEPDGRSKMWFVAPKEKLLEVCPLLNHILSHKH